jgi:hypothetical protein
MVCNLYVLTASPSGPVGIVKEMFAVATAVADLKKDEGAPHILKDLFAEGEPQAETKIEVGDKDTESAQAVLVPSTVPVIGIDAALARVP